MDAFSDGGIISIGFCVRCFAGIRHMMTPYLLVVFFFARQLIHLIMSDHSK